MTFVPYRPLQYPRFIDHVVEVQLLFNCLELIKAPAFYIPVAEKTASDDATNKYHVGPSSSLQLGMVPWMLR